MAESAQSKPFVRDFGTESCEPHGDGFFPSWDAADLEHEPLLDHLERMEY